MASNKKRKIDLFPQARNVVYLIGAGATQSELLARNAADWRQKLVKRYGAY